jgi:MYXO-CTERM domain-containing protein
MKTYALLGAVALITSSASAIFTGWTTESSVVGDRTIYKIYANFSNTGTAGSEGSAARVLNVFDFGKADATPEGNQIAGGRLGAMGAVHNDNFIGDVDVDGDGYPDVVGSVGTWAGDGCTAAQSTTDSFVTLQGVGNTGGWGTALDPSFAVPFGPNADDISPPGNINAGWYDSTPGTANLVGAGLKVRLLQIARLTSNTSVFTANMTLGYAAFGQTTPLFGYGSFTIGAVPAPGALALLGLAGAFGRRRRS